MSDRSPSPEPAPGRIPARLALTLLDQADLPEESRRWLLEVVVRECERMTRMIDDLREAPPV
jgi:hypothetical protein